MPEKSDVLQGTLTLMVLKTLDVLGPLHGYGIGQYKLEGDELSYQVPATAGAGTVRVSVWRRVKPEHRGAEWLASSPYGSRRRFSVPMSEK